MTPGPIIGDQLKNRGITVRAIYLCGGTSTVLFEKDLQRILTILNEKFISPSVAEITVEVADLISYH